MSGRTGGIGMGGLEASRRIGAIVASALLTSGGFAGTATPASAADGCGGGAVLTAAGTVTCTSAGSYVMTLPPGTSYFDAEIAGGGGGGSDGGLPHRSGGRGLYVKVDGLFVRPGTKKVKIVVGTGGAAQRLDDPGSYGHGGGASAIYALAA